MEIGTEISKKIRAAIKSKLQELGAYIDEELPDYIMVMVANKKTSQQMTEDLSLFLGNNTIKFTTWLHGVLEKLRSVAGEPPSSLRHLQSDSVTVYGKPCIDENGRAEDLKLLAVSSSRTDRMEAPVSSSAYDSRKGMLGKGFSRHTSTIKPHTEPLPSEAVIDIKPEMDDDLIAEEPVEMGSGRTRGAGRPTLEIYRPGQSKFTSMSSLEMCRPPEGSSSMRQQDGRSGKASRTGLSKQEEMSRKRKAPVASSIVRVNQADDEDSDDAEDDDDDAGFGSRSLSSRVSLPSKPERKPTLPPAKQANRNLILKAISEAQDSITKTTSYPPIPQRQTVPVAPRTRLASSEEMTAALQLMQNLHSLAPRAEAYAAANQPASRTTTGSLASRLQLDGSDARQQREYGAEAPAGCEPKSSDTRSFIMSRPVIEEASARSQQQVQPPALPRTVQAREGVDTSSPKFIVTLDGVPSPLGNLTDGDMELDDVRPLSKATEAAGHVYREPKVSVMDRLQGVVVSSEDGRMDVDVADEDNVPVKKQKVMERCKFWPVCKSGDECVYHHPTAQCKTFPNCKFGDKCLFVHPNCKYDARCTKPDCPFTHVSRRGTAAPPLRPVVQQSSSATVCRFFPECKKVDCTFYHPKPCRFATQCKRAGCTFYHPTTAVPPRHALKWTKDRAAN